MILMFLGSFRATVAVFLSIPLSVMITFFVLHSAGKTINSMVLSGLALAFSRLIDDSVVVLENIYRHLEMGEDPKRRRRERRERSGARGSGHHAGRRRCVFSRSRFCSASASICSRRWRWRGHRPVRLVFRCRNRRASVLREFPQGRSRAWRTAREHSKKSWGDEIPRWIQRQIRANAELLRAMGPQGSGSPACRSSGGFVGCFSAELSAVSLIGVSFFPRTDAGQFVINVKAPTGTRIEVTEGYIKQVEEIVRQVVTARRLEHGRFEHRRHARPLGSIYAQLRHAHRLRPGWPEGRPSRKQLRIHERRARAHRDAASGITHVLPIRRLGGRGP